MSFEPREYLRHILTEADFLVDAGRDLTLERFQEDATLQRAFVRSLEVIGEATKKLPEEYRSKHPQVEWRSMARMRDRLIHGYFSVDLGLVWEFVQQRIPPLQQAISQHIGRAGIVPAARTLPNNGLQGTPGCP